MNTIERLEGITSQLRRDVIRMVNMAGSGHPGGSFSCTDVMTALYFHIMKHDPVTWTRDSRNQDVFIPSAGHLAPIYYAALARAGYFPVSELSTLRKFGTRLQGHPSVEHELPGVVQASGSLGQGLSCGAGMAIAKKMDGETNKVYVLVGDGETEEGQIWEAAIFAAHHKLDNLIAITDWNRKQIDGDVEDVASLGDLQAKWESFGWRVIVIENGNDMTQVVAALEEAGKPQGKPVMVLSKTKMGYGVDFMTDKHGWHGKAPNADETAAALSQLKETLGDF